MKFVTVTQIVLYRGQTVKISNFFQTKMAAAAILKNNKNAISQQWIDRSSRNLGRLCKMGLFTAQTVPKILNFQNPRWRTAAILKTVKLLYLRNRLTDFDEIWHGDADWPLQGAKISHFSKTKMAPAAILKITKKSRYLRNC